MKPKVKNKALTSKSKALKIVTFLEKVKAQNPVILDLGKESQLCDYFIIASGSSSTQVGAMLDAVVKSCRKNKIDVDHYEDDPDKRWVFIDLFDVIVHIFIEEARNFYNLEYLYKTAKRLPLKVEKK